MRSLLASPIGILLRLTLLLITLGVLLALVRLTPWRVDLSGGRIDSLSPELRAELGDLDDLLLITFYNSGNWGLGRVSTTTRIRDHLNALQQEVAKQPGGGVNSRILVREIDPLAGLEGDKRVDRSEQLAKRGLRLRFETGATSGNGGSDGGGQEEIYGYYALQYEFGGRSWMVAEPGQAAGAQTGSSKALEAETLRAIRGLKRPQLTFGIYSPRPQYDIGAILAPLRAELSTLGTVLNLGQADHIPESVDFLLIISPDEETDEDLLAAMREYLKAGKPAIFLADGAWPKDGRTFVENKSPVHDLLAECGVGVEAGLITEFSNEIVVKEPIDFGGGMPILTANYFKFQLAPPLLRTKEPIATALPPIVMAYATPLRLPEQGDNLAPTVILASASERSYSRRQPIIPFPDPRYTPDPELAGERPVIVAVHTSTALATEGDPKSAASTASTLPHNLVVVGGSLFLIETSDGIAFFRSLIEGVLDQATAGAVARQKAAPLPILRSLTEQEKTTSYVGTVAAPLLLLIAGYLLAALLRARRVYNQARSVSPGR